jgi:hypothetical protein
MSPYLFDQQLSSNRPFTRVTDPKSEPTADLEHLFYFTRLPEPTYI